MRKLAYGFLAAFFLYPCFCYAAPEPAIVPGAEDWTIDVTFEHPRQIVMNQQGNEKPGRFWYTIITLTNKTDHDLEFYPQCDLMTDTFQIISAGKDVSPTVFEQVKRRHKKAYPFLEPLDGVGNRILQGQDNTKDVAIIWPDFDPNAKNIKLFLTGLSNETAVIDHPVAKDENGNPLKVFLRKTLELNYNLGGDPALRSGVKLTYQDKRWIMR